MTIPEAQPEQTYIVYSKFEQLNYGTIVASSEEDALTQLKAQYGKRADAFALVKQGDILCG